MSTHTIRLDDGVKEETTRIADALGLNFNLVVNTLLRKFNAEKGFPFPVRLGSEKTVLDMSSEEFEAACREAVQNRDDSARMEYTTVLDPDTGMFKKLYADGRVEYVLD